jgi:hypothetical protein
VRIERVLLHHVGPFADLDLHFPRGSDDRTADVHLLVGENGTGKSTVLAALAQPFGAGDAGFARRAWADGEARAAVCLDGAGRVAISPAGTANRVLAFEGQPPLKVRHNVGGVLYSSTAWADGRHLDGETATGPLDACVFAYGGLRAATEAAVTGVQEQRDDPRADANLFHRTTGTQPLVQWVANTYAMSAIYAKKGDSGRADDRAGALRSLEEALATVTGESRVSFVVEVDPFAVRLAVGKRPAVPIQALPDGVQSLLSWVGDLLMRLDRIKWSASMPTTERAFVLLLDEVEVHLHPRWQRSVLPMAERLFPRAQIIASTHSPFVIGSASDAWVHRFRETDAGVVVDPPVRGPLGQSSAEIVREIMGLPTDFDEESERRLDALRAAISARARGDEAAQIAVEREWAWLAARSPELAVIARHEIGQLRRLLGTAAK